MFVLGLLFVFAKVVLVAGAACVDTVDYVAVGLTQDSSHCVRLSRISHAYGDFGVSADYCAGKGGKLVTITTDEDNTKFKSLTALTGNFQISCLAKANQWPTLASTRIRAMYGNGSMGIRRSTISVRNQRRSNFV